MIDVKIKPSRENFRMPEIMSVGAACYDVFASRIELNESADKAIIYLGFELEVPVGWKAVLVPRSSQNKYYWTMLNSPGIIDSDFRGELQLRMTCIPKQEMICMVYEAHLTQFPFKVGESVGQMYFERVNEISFVLSDSLSETKRGSGGFGSTNK